MAEVKSMFSPNKFWSSSYISRDLRNMKIRKCRFKATKVWIKCIGVYIMILNIIYMYININFKNLSILKIYGELIEKKELLMIEWDYIALNFIILLLNVKIRNSFDIFQTQSLKKNWKRSIFISDFISEHVWNNHLRQS